MIFLKIYLIGAIVYTLYEMIELYLCTKFPAELDMLSPGIDLSFHPFRSLLHIILWPIFLVIEIICIFKREPSIDR